MNQQQQQQYFNQKLLSQFLFLFDRNCVSTQTIVEKLKTFKPNFKSDLLQNFFDVEKDTTNDEDAKREEFNGIILDMIDTVASTTTTTTNGASSSSSSSSHYLSNIEDDLQFLISTVFVQEASVSLFWKATEQSRWRSTAFQKETLSLTNFGTESSVNEQPNNSSNNNQSASAGKLVYGIMMATEL